MVNREWRNACAVFLFRSITIHDNDDPNLRLRIISQYGHHFRNVRLASLSSMSTFRDFLNLAPVLPNSTANLTITYNCLKGHFPPFFASSARTETLFPAFLTLAQKFKRLTLSTTSIADVLQTLYLFPDITFDFEFVFRR